MQNEALKQLLMEVGPLAPRLQAIQSDSENYWRIIIADDDGRDAVEIVLVNEPDQMKAVLAAGIGRVAEENQIATYRFALQYNYLWERTGGLRVCMDADRNLELLVDLATSRLTTETLVQVLEGFARRALELRVLVGDGGIKEPGAVAELTDVGPLHEMLV